MLWELQILLEIVWVGYNMCSAVTIGSFVYIFIIFSHDKSDFDGLNKLTSFCFMKDGFKKPLNSFSSLL